MNIDDPIRDHGPLVGFVIRTRCRHYLGTPRVYDEDDAAQDGYVGLLRAVATFDSDRGFRFSTYATDCIFSAISNGHRTAMGSSYRRAVDRGEFFCSALSLQRVVNEEGDTFLDLLADRPMTDDPPDPERERMLDDLLDSLSERDRIVVTNQSREAGALLGIKPTSAARRRQRIYDRLRLEMAS